MVSLIGENYSREISSTSVTMLPSTVRRDVNMFMDRRNSVLRR